MGAEQVSEVARHLTERDREIALCLYDQQLLTTDQLELLFFSSRRRAQDRLLFLYRNRIVDRFYPPEQQAQKLRERLAGLGEDAAAWGLRTVRQEDVLAADRFVEALLPHAVECLYDLMRETKTDRLPGVGSAELRGPPEDVPSKRWWDDMFSWEVRSRVRLLGGI